LNNVEMAKAYLEEALRRIKTAGEPLMRAAMHTA